MIGGNARAARLRILGDVTPEQIEVYAPSLSDLRYRDIAMAYFVRSDETTVQIAERHGISTGRLVQLAHKIVRLTQWRIAQKKDPAEVVYTLQMERTIERNRRMKADIYPRLKKIKIPKRNVTVLQKELFYQLGHRMITDIHDQVFDAFTRVLNSAVDLEDAKNLWSAVKNVRDELDKATTNNYVEDDADTAQDTF